MRDSSPVYLLNKWGKMGVGGGGGGAPPPPPPPPPPAPRFIEKMLR
jgi:hypothetical protein